MVSFTSLPFWHHLWEHPMRGYVLLFTGHLATAQLAFTIYQGIAPAIIWPAAGVALAGLVLGGRKLWPAIAGASLVNGILIGQPAVLIIAIAVASTLQAFIGASLLERFKFDVLMSRLHDTSVFILVSLGMTMIGPAIILTILLSTNMIVADSVPGHFGRWWLASASGVIIFGGFLIRWLARSISPRTISEWIESVIVYTAVCTIAYVLAWLPQSSIFGVSLVYVLLAPFFWIALRNGPRLMTLAILSITLIFLTGVTWGWNESSASLSQRIISAELLSLMWAMIFLFLVSANEERKEAVRAFSGQVDQLEGIIKKIRADERVKTEFLATLSHELRNPLAPILSSLELLKLKETDPDERAQLLDSIEERINSMSRLLDDLLDISRITRRKLKLKRETVDARVVIKRSISTLESLFVSKNHSIEVSMPDLPLLVHADPLRLEQIAVNLLTNSAKYTEPGGLISITLRQAGDEMELCIRDNGIGIPPNMIRLVFEPFIQLPNSSSRSGSGLGIGLSLSKKLVELHKGKITAKSEGFRKGSEFTVRLPIPPLKQLAIPEVHKVSQAKTAVEAKEPVSANPLKVLVVDDNEAAAHGIEKLLKYKGYDVAVAYDGGGALRMVTSFKPRVVVLDIGLPDMDGYMVAKELRDNGSDAFIVALTGYGQEDDKAKAREFGFDRHLTKPVGIDNLEEAIKPALTALRRGTVVA